jgi:uncharacterized membrane protein
MVKVIPLSIILMSAGLIHLLDPFAFVNALPLWTPFKLEIIYVSGVFEFFLAIGLCWKKSRFQTAKITAWYFVWLVPIHLYVSIYSIPMFGISAPALLWSRTVFQAVLIWWAWSLRKV